MYLQGDLENTFRNRGCSITKVQLVVNINEKPKVQLIYYREYKRVDGYTGKNKTAKHSVGEWNSIKAFTKIREKGH
jgi:heterodisulfide reductase subunit A-like polyferredoxin